MLDETARQHKIGGREHERVEVGVPEKQVPTGGEHAGHLSDERLRVVQALDRVMRDGGVEARCAEGQRLVQISDDRSDAYISGQGLGQLRLLEVKAYQVRVRIQPGKQRDERSARPATEIDYACRRGQRQNGSEILMTLRPEHLAIVGRAHRGVRLLLGFPALDRPTQKPEGGKRPRFRGLCERERRDSNPRPPA